MGRVRGNQFASDHVWLQAPLLAHAAQLLPEEKPGLDVVVGALEAYNR